MRRLCGRRLLLPKRDYFAIAWRKQGPAPPLSVEKKDKQDRMDITVNHSGIEMKLWHSDVFIVIVTPWGWPHIVPRMKRQ